MLGPLLLEQMESSLDYATVRVKPVGLGQRIWVMREGCKDANVERMARVGTTLTTFWLIWNGFTDAMVLAGIKRATYTANLVQYLGLTIDCT